MQRTLLEASFHASIERLKPATTTVTLDDLTFLPGSRDCSLPRDFLSSAFHTSRQRRYQHINDLSLFSSFFSTAGSLHDHLVWPVHHIINWSVTAVDLSIKWLGRVLSPRDIAARMAL
jgi:hypothetical protein